VIISLRRRVALAIVALLIAGSVLRGPIALALVTRGDDALRSGDRAAGVHYYERALAFDPRSARAADRLAFALAMQHDPTAAQAAVAIASAALATTPDDPALLADRGLAEQRLRRWRDAETDFAHAGQAGRDARYDHLAGRLALRRHDHRAARVYFLAALRLDPAFAPARAALAQT
jgi:tetratricopeptide (TPR) repeat protein